MPTVTPIAILYVVFPVQNPTAFPSPEAIITLFDVTVVKPASVVEVAPNAIEVLPTVIVLLAKLAFVIPAVPERLLLVKPVIVLDPAAIVLLVRVSVPARVASVPVVGKVTLVAAVVVKPNVCAPVWVKLPPIVIVLPELFTPVPPY